MVSKYIPGTVLSGASELIRELGGDAEAMAMQAGLPVTCLTDGDIQVDIAAVLRFFDLAAEICHCRGFGLILASRSGMDVFGPLWVLLRSARTVRQMLRDLGHNYDLFTRAASITLEEDEKNLWLCWDTAMTLSMNTVQGAEYGFALAVGEIRKIDPKFTPLAVEFRHCAPSDRSLHHQLFGQYLTFNQARNAICFPSQTLDATLDSADSRAHALAQAELRRQVGAAQAGLAARIENIVRALLPYSACTVEEVARAIGMSERFLQVRLKEQGTSFKQLKAAVRYDLALKYLHSSNQSLAEISEILGYSELSAFSRSFKRWHGQPANEVRRQARSSPGATTQ